MLIYFNVSILTIMRYHSIISNTSKPWYSDFGIPYRPHTFTVNRSNRDTNYAKHGRTFLYVIFAYAKSPSSNFQLEWFLRGIIDVRCTASMCNFLSRNSERDLPVDKRRETGKTQSRAAFPTYVFGLAGLAGQMLHAPHDFPNPGDKTFRWQIRRKMVAGHNQVRAVWNEVAAEIQAAGRYVHPILDSRGIPPMYILHNRGKIFTQLPVYASFPFTFPVFLFLSFFVFLSTEARRSVWRISRAQMKLRTREKEINVNRMCAFRSERGGIS